MSIQKAKAIILRSRKQGETSKILTMYSQEFGKMALMAKGSRGVKSKYLGTLETFNHVSLIFYRKEQRQMQYLSQASIIDSFSSLHNELGKLSLAAILCEIVDKSEDTEHANAALFQLLLDGLQAIDQNARGLRNIVRAFQIKFISHSGFEPELAHCHFCKKQEPTEQNYFSLEHGMYSCAACGFLKNGVLLNDHAIQVLRWFYETPIARAAEANVSKATGELLDTFLNDYLQYHIEPLYALKSVQHLKTLQSKFSNSM